MGYFVAGLPSRLTLRRLLVLPLVVAALLVGVVKGVEAWWYKSEFARAGRDMALGRYAPALARLEPFRPAGRAALTSSTVSVFARQHLGMLTPP